MIRNAGNDERMEHCELGRYGRRGLHQSLLEWRSATAVQQGHYGSIPARLDGRPPLLEGTWRHGRRLVPAAAVKISKPMEMGLARTRLRSDGGAWVGALKFAATFARRRLSACAKCVLVGMGDAGRR
jgi:hypothetical protein